MFPTYPNTTILPEMGAYVPVPGGIPQYCVRLTNELLGFSLGWNVSIDDINLKLIFLGSCPISYVDKRSLHSEWVRV